MILKGSVKAEMKLLQRDTTAMTFLWMLQFDTLEDESSNNNSLKPLDQMANKSWDDQLWKFEIVQDFHNLKHYIVCQQAL